MAWQTQLRDARGRFVKAGSISSAGGSIALDAEVKFDTKKVEDAVDRAAFRNFGHAAARIRKDAQVSIEKSAEPSPPGEPPHTRRGLMRRALRFSANKEGAVIGPMASIAGTAGQPHEFGGEYKGDDYPERPFMGPALEKNLARFASDWAGSVGS